MSVTSAPLRPCISGRAPLASAARLYELDVVRRGERGARHAVQEIAGQRLARRERDRMQQAVERAPLGAERGEQRVDVLVLRHVAGQHRHGPELGGDLDDAVLEVVVDVGERERRALAPARRATP